MMSNSNDFNKPQRQSAIGILVFFADTFQNIIRGLLPVIVIWTLKFDQINKIYLVLGSILVVSIIALISYLKFINFTFYIDEDQDEFIINKGVFNKTKIAIQLNKIQQVNINQSFIQKIIGVYALQVDTAGSNNKEVSIRAISHDLALALKTKLLDNTSDKSEISSEQVAVEIAEKESIKISFLSLVKVGLTSKYAQTFAIIMAFFVAIFDKVSQFSRENSAIENQIDNYANRAASIVGILIIIFFILVLIINLSRTLIKYFDFEILKQQKSIVLSYGLLNKKTTIIKPEKVQIVTISSNYLQKKLNVLDIRIKQASVGVSEKEEQKSAIEIPGCNPAERDEIIKMLFQKLPSKDFTLQPNIRIIIASILKFIIFPTIILIVLINVITLSDYHYLLFIPIYLLIVIVSIYFGFKNSKLFISQNHIIKQSGVWDIDQEIIEISKIQAITVKQLFWHKKPNIGSLVLHTAGGNLSFQLANFIYIKQLVNTWLYQVESTKKSWNT